MRNNPANQRTPGRGRDVESEVAALLRGAGLRVEVDVAAARPRQTDLYARGEGLDLLVEVKARKRKIDVSDVDALRSRLRRTTEDVVGAIFTTSGLTSGAIAEIESDRTREVLVFVKEEIELLRSAPEKLLELIASKRHKLRVRGTAWFGLESSSEFLGVKLPLGNVEFRLGKTVGPYFASRAETWSACYTLQIPDSGWGIASGEGALLPLRLKLRTIQDLQNVLGYLHEKFGLSNDGMFSIHQSNACWYGVGADNLIRAIVRWRERYEKSRLRRVHHSEAFCYFGHFHSGWISLSSQQRVGLMADGMGCSSFLHASDLAIQLPGIPVDMTPFLNLCQYTGNGWAYFEHVGRRLTHGRRLKEAIRLEVIGQAVSTLDDERVIVGVIAKNPFFRKPLPRELQCDDLAGFADLNRTELLLCNLRDWHDEGMVTDAYMLQGFEVTWTYREQMIRPYGTWNRITEWAEDREVVA
jgi:hypothetical protein